MYILGLHFGHDASVTIVKNGKILVCVERERRTRVRHAIGITIDDIYTALNTAGCSVADIDYCSVTSTQHIEYIFPNPQELIFKIDLQSTHIPLESWLSEITASELNQRQFKQVLSLAAEGVDHPYVRRLTEELINAEQKLCIGGIEDYFSAQSWKRGAKLDEIGNLIVEEPLADKMCQVMQIPILLTLNGKQIPGWMMSHHFAHAAYAYYTSGYDRAAIITQDGSLPRGGYWNGMCYYGIGKKLYPIMPHYLNIGRLYEGVSVLLGFDLEAGPGKMMGLSSYGKPTFFDKRFVGNVEDIDAIVEDESSASFPRWNPHPFDRYLNKWIKHCASKADKLGYDISSLGNTEKIMEPISVDLAASTQVLLEEILLATVKTVYDVYNKHDFDTAENLCLSGGTALNCPANSRIYNEGPFNNVFIPPAVHDGGLSTGSALSVYHNTLMYPRSHNYGNTAKLSYLGLTHDTSKISDVLNGYSDRISYSYKNNVKKVIAMRLAKNNIIALFNGRSEVGPRALGHRSILAHPGHEENWKKVNVIKKREYWRPFAPAVIESKAKELFDGTPEQSPFMLFIARVLQLHVPAITHVDGSSRIQTVNEDSPELYGILTEFDQLTGIPVLLNTSFNGPGEPIIENPEEAITFFLESNLDALFIENFEITKL